MTTLVSPPPPIEANRHQVLLNLLVAADRDGNPPVALQKLQLFVTTNSYTNEEIAAVAEAFKRHKAQPQPTLLQPGETVLQTGLAVHNPLALQKFYTTPIGGAPSGTQAGASDDEAGALVAIDSESIFHAFGQRMEQVFQAYGCKVWYLNEYKDTNRFHKFLFGWAPPMKWTLIASLRTELMAHVHVRDERGQLMSMPEKDIFIQPRRASRFEVQIPKTEWVPCNLLEFLVVGGKVSKMSPAEPLRVPIGVDLDGEMVFLDLEDGTLIAGMINSGKSSLQKALLTALLLLYSPSHLQIVAMDFKQGVSFDKFGQLPWIWGGDIIQDEKTALTTIRNLIAEAQRRNEQLFKPNRVENIREYNALHPAAPLYWIVVLIDEFAALKASAGAEALFPLTNEGAAMTRSAGIVWIICTQRPEKRVIDPITRANLGNRLALKVSSTADSEIILGEGSRQGGQAKHLEGAGDGLLQRGSTMTRFQSFFIDNDVLLKLIDQSRAHYEQLKFRRPTVTTVRQTLEELFPATEGTAGEGDEDDPDYALYLKYKVWADYNANPATKKKRSQNELLRELFGSLYDDPKKAHNGANFQLNKDRIQRLIGLYEGQ